MFSIKDLKHHHMTWGYRKKTEISQISDGWLMFITSG